MEEFPVQTGCVYVAGLSAGGAAAAVMVRSTPIYLRLSAYTPASPAGLLATLAPRSLQCCWVDAAARRRRPGAADDRLPRRSRHDRASCKRRPCHRSVEGRRDPPNDDQPRPRRRRDGLHPHRSERRKRASDIGTLGTTRSRPCLVWRESGWFLYRAVRTGRDS